MRSEWSTEKRIASWTLVGEDWQLVSSLCLRRRSATAGTAGADQRFLSAHQANHEPTAARLRCQVAAAADPTTRSASRRSRRRRRQPTAARTELGGS